MAGPLSVLLVEDSPSDAKIAARLLGAAFDPLRLERVQDANGLEAALSATRWDIVISDFSLPGFDAHAALAIVRGRERDLPLIVVSGTIGEEVAVELIRAGAQDVVHKDRISRLVAVVEREIALRDERRCHARALATSNAMLERLSEAGVVGIMLSTSSGPVVEANDAFLRMVGYSREDLAAGRIDWKALTPPESTAVTELLQQGIDERGAASPVEKEYLRKDGGRVPVLVSLARLDADRNVALVADLTTQKRAQAELQAAEERLRQAQKLEAIGALAGGIAHDFNNVLSVILSYSELLLEDPRADEEVRADLAEIHAAGKRAASLTRQLLAFSRKQILDPRVLDLNAVIGGMEKMMRRLIGEDVSLVFLGAPDLGRARLDPGQLEQVVLNLVINARDAMPGGGSITIETSNIELDEAYAAVHGSSSGPHVLLAVSDTGTGIDEATRARVFEPFFTTKPAGQGTGLGLSTVFGIVKQSGGSIWVYSELGIGTTFKVYFPRTQESASTTTSSAASARTLRGSETILLVEDDPAVRQLAAALLRRLGYRVIETADVDDAVARCRSHGGKIDLLLTDVVMPRMSGPELADVLLRLKPELKVLFMSGYADRGIFRHGVLESGTLFVQKPLTPDALARGVRTALGDSDGEPSSSR